MLFVSDVSNPRRNYGPQCVDVGGRTRKGDEGSIFCWIGLQLGKEGGVVGGMSVSFTLYLNDHLDFPSGVTLAWRVWYKPLGLRIPTRSVRVSIKSCATASSRAGWGAAK